MLPSIDSMLRGYTNRIQTKRDVLNVLEQYKALICKCGPFVFNDGRSKELLHLEGTIPVTYKGAVYNIPICIYLMDTHPEHAPICFVTPTADMQIKVSMYVDHNGKIYLPQLHDWNPLSSNLMSLVQVMVKIFGEVPPVFSKPRETQAPYPVQQPMYMPMPGTTMPSPYMPQMQHSQPPVVSTASSYPPQPPYPLGNNSVSYPPYPTQSPALTNANSGTITEEHIKASLLSAVQDKLKLKLNEDFAQCRAELDILKQTSMELNMGKTKIQDIMEKLNKEKSDLDRYINILKDREAELQKAISQLEEQGDIDVDEAVTTTAPLYKQILNAYAEEAATEDTIYYMGEALRRGVIDLDVFLKQVRSLSRKQFMLRALMQKCRTKAGLAG